MANTSESGIDFSKIPNQQWDWCAESLARFMLDEGIHESDIERINIYQYYKMDDLSDVITIRVRTRTNYYEVSFMYEEP